MNQATFDDFVSGNDTLRVYAGKELVFRSTGERLFPLLDYLKLSNRRERVEIADRIIGNAAALLCVRANCSEVYSPLGREAAVVTLCRYGVGYHFNAIVPSIMDSSGKPCPMERLSMDKEPEQFYQMMARAKPV